MTVDAFHKGDAVTRALIGPVGLFVGATKVQYYVSVTDGHGAAVMDEEMKATVRGESESLSLGDRVAKAVGRKLQAKRVAAGS